MSHASDPHALTFTYATGHGDILVRPPGIVELSLTAERLVTSPEGGRDTEPVVCARLAMPVDSAEALAQVLLRVAADQRGEPEESGDPGVTRDQIAVGLMSGCLMNVVGALVARLDPLADRVGLLSEIEEETISKAKNAVFEGADMSDEGPAVETVVQGLREMFATWREGLK